MPSTAAVIEFFVSSEVHKYLSNKELLKPGDRLEGTVVEFKKNGAVLMDFGKFRSLANVKFPVSVGEKIPVSVVGTGDNLTLRLHNPQVPVTAQTREIIGKIEIMPGKSLADLQSLVVEATETLGRSGEAELSKAVENALARLAEHFKPIDAAKDLFQVFTQLKNHLTKSGVFFEKGLENIFSQVLKQTGVLPEAKQLAQLPQVRELTASDLKPNLLVLKEFLQRPQLLNAFAESSRVQGLKEMVEELLSSISHKQEQAVAKNANPQQDAPQVFNFTIPLKDNPIDAKLKVYYNKKDEAGGKGKKGFRLSLLLSMERLGDIRTDFHMVGRSLNVTFFVKDYGLRNRLAGEVYELEESLRRFFEYLVLNVIVSERKVVDFDTEDLEISVDRMVDLKA